MEFRKVRFENPFRIDDPQWKTTENDWSTCGDIYGLIRQVSARFTIKEQRAGVWISANLSHYSEYSLRITPMNLERLSTKNLYAHLYQRGVCTRTYGDFCDYVPVASVRLDELTGLTWQDTMEATLRLEDGTITAWVNGTQILQTPALPAYCTEGTFGLKSIFDVPADIEWVEVEYAPMDKPAETDTPEVPTQFACNFAELSDGVLPDVWVCPYGETSWKIFDGALTCTADDGYHYTHLHAFDRDTTMESTVSMDGNGACGFLFRMGPDKMYLKLQADLSLGQWQLLEADLSDRGEILRATAPLEEKGQFRLRVELRGHCCYVYEDDKLLLSCEEKLRCMGFGRMGFFCDGAKIAVKDVAYTFPSATIPNRGVSEYYAPEPGISAASMLVLPLGGDEAIGLCKSGNNFKFEQNGAICTMIPGEQYREVNPGRKYLSVLKLSSGKYLRISEIDMSSFLSDDLIHWEKVGMVVPPEDLYDASGRQKYTFHVNTLREIQLPSGKKRIFFPLARRTFLGDVSGSSTGNYSYVFYSDDGGCNWIRSETSTLEAALDTVQPCSKWGEAKIILCADGSLRMYMSRGRVGAIQYLVSRDEGKTWGEYGIIPEMQCAMSSFCVIQDPDTGLYYFVWVNDTPQFHGAGMWRTRLSLARSADGIHWDFLCDLDRMDRRTDYWCSSPLFQHVDPSISILNGYLIATFGRGENLSAENYGVGSVRHHRGQCLRIVRIPLANLEPRPWDAATISNTIFPKQVQVIQLPDKLTYKVGEQVDLTGGVVRVTAFNGTTEDLPMTKLFFRQEPVLDAPGKKTITVYHIKGISCTFEITIF